MSSNLTSLTQGIFTVNSTGKVKIDYLYDGGQNKGELAIFSLQGMENMDPSSSAFITEAAKRALSNSTLGYVAIKDTNDRARFSGNLAWERDFNGGEYRGQQIFNLEANSTFTMMLVSNGTIAALATNPLSTTNPPLFSFGTINGQNTTTIPQMVDITGKKNTFGWEDTNNGWAADRDYNDLVLQVDGATANAPMMDTYTYANRDWRGTSVGEELIGYTNRLQFDKGTFEVNPTGQVEIDYLFDGGWFQGELAVFSLDGMEAYQPGSVEFITEAARRSLSNSNQGRVVIRDQKEGALFHTELGWEKDFNSGAYSGKKTFNMKAADHVAFMMVQNTTVADLYRNPNHDAWGTTPIFSIPNLTPNSTGNQLVAVDEHGTYGFEDVPVQGKGPNLDYNDLVFQAHGLTGNVASMDDNIDPSRDWRKNVTGINLLTYAARPSYSSGVFQVGETGKVTFDYLYDGGWFQGELGVFSLSGMEKYELGSTVFIQEAAKRASSNTNQGRVFLKDQNEGSQFSANLSWEKNFNAGTYQGMKTFSLTPGDEFAFMLIQNTTIQEIANKPNIINQYGKLPIFSIPEANPGGVPANQIVSVDRNGTYAFEDVRVDWGGSDRDYNDVVFQITGAKGSTQSIDQAYNPDLDWRITSMGQQLLTYANRSIFDEGVFEVSQSGQVTLDYLYDGGIREGELGIFSLQGMNTYEIGSLAFTEEALGRATSNSTRGYVVVEDTIQAAKYSHSEDIHWEGDYNWGEYQGEKTFAMTSGDIFGLVYTPEGSLADKLINPQGIEPEKLFFSMPEANLNHASQVAQALSSNQGSILTLEDVHLDYGSNKDYNDLVLSIKGAQSVGFTELNDVIRDDRNWQDTGVGQSIFNEIA